MHPLHAVRWLSTGRRRSSPSASTITTMPRSRISRRGKAAPVREVARRSDRRRRADQTPADEQRGRLRGRAQRRHRRYRELIVAVEDALALVAGLCVRTTASSAGTSGSATASRRAASRSTRTARWAGSGPGQRDLRPPITTVLRRGTCRTATGDIVFFSIAEVIAYISEAITLEPGDLILTGTRPASVWRGCRPYLPPGRHGHGGDRGCGDAHEPGGKRRVGNPFSPR